jgi:hypothetical protein
MIAPPMPCTARALLSIAMSVAAAHAAEATVKMARPMAKSRRRPMRSASEPAVSTVVAIASVYASTVHCRPARPAFRSSAIRERAVLTTAMSSMSIAVAAQTTTSVQRFVSIWFVSLSIT